MIDVDAFDRFEARGWQDRATGYDVFFGQVTSRVAESLLDAAGVGPGDRTLDLACGPGYVTGLAAKRGAVPLGIDVAESMVALARRHHPELEFRLGAAQELPVADASFDATVGNFAILHLGRPEQAIAELVRVLTPGGGLAITTWDRPERARLLGVFVDAVANAGAQPSDEVPRGPDFFRFSDERELGALLRGAGLEEVGVETIAFAHTVPDPDSLWAGMLGATVRTSAMVLYQPRAVQRRIRAAFDELIEPYRQCDGTLELPVSVKVAFGIKPGVQA